MKYFVDSIDINEVIHWRDMLGKSFEGMTTNRTMLKSYNDMKYFLHGTDGVLSTSEINNLTIMMQPMDMEAASMIEDANKNNKHINFVAKFPVVESYMEMIQNFSTRKIQTCATSVYNLIQLDQAINFKMNWSMVYYKKNPDRSFLAKARLKYKEKLVAASLRDTYDVIHAIDLGYQYATVKPSVLEKIFNNKKSLEELNG